MICKVLQKMKSTQTPYPEGYKDLQHHEMGSADYARKRSCRTMGSFGYVLQFQWKEANNPRSKSAINQTWHSREGYKPSVPWLRARERYRLRNSITGVVLIGFIGGVCMAPFSYRKLICRLVYHKDC